MLYYAVKKTTAIFGSGCVCIKLPISSHYLWEKASCKLRTSGSHCAKTGGTHFGEVVSGVSACELAGIFIETQPADCYSVYNRDNREDGSRYKNTYEIMHRGNLIVYCHEHEFSNPQWTRVGIQNSP